MTFPLPEALCWVMRTKRITAHRPRKPRDLGALMLASLDLAISEGSWEVAEHLMQAIESLEGPNKAELCVRAAYLRLIQDVDVDADP